MIAQPSGTSVTSKQNFVERSDLYQEFLAERDEILRHKWLESEKAGHDIGFDRALLDWIRHHRDAWRLTRRADTKKA
jgi:hypothetical protein